MFGPILCMYEIETSLDQVSGVCGLLISVNLVSIYSMFFICFMQHKC